ncbi:MAG: 3'(2'),5'-bisphosphate nucleotidase CysQ [Bacteroidales bacterium]|nr:3'(2'),5'-bisphosphate nucleotidase CysQ [Bacteroidales bacterium]
MYRKHLITAIKSALKAGKAILEVYDSEFDVEMKEDQSPLTTADKKSHSIIDHALKKTGIPVLSEEGKNIPYSQRKDWDLLWIVDPLDGTKEFIKKNGEFTVNIALVMNGRPILGVIYVPVLDVLYFASRNEGSYKMEQVKRFSDPDWHTLIKNASLLPLKVSKNRYTVVGSRSHMNQETQRFIAKKKKKHGEIEIISQGSSLKFCMVAEGKADVYPRFAPTSEWDTAAGQAIVEHAGGSVTLTDGETPLIYNKENILNPNFIVFG